MWLRQQHPLDAGCFLNCTHVCHLLSLRSFCCSSVCSQFVQQCVPGLVSSDKNPKYEVLPSSQGYGFSCGHVWMWELDCEESWVLKNWCVWTVVLEKTLQSPLDCKEIPPVHSEGDQPWDFFGRNDAKAETQYFGNLTRRGDSGKDWRWEGLGAGGEGDDRGWDGRMASLTRWTWVWVSSKSWWWGPACCNSWGRKSRTHLSDWTELNWR